MNKLHLLGMLVALLIGARACPVLSPSWNSANINLNWVDQAEVIVINDLFAINDITACPMGLDQCTVLQWDCLSVDVNADAHEYIIYPNNSFALKVGSNPNGMTRSICFKCCKGTSCFTKQQYYKVTEHPCRTAMVVYSNWTMPISNPYTLSSPSILTVDQLLDYTSPDCALTSVPIMSTRTPSFCLNPSTTGSVTHLSDTQLSISTDIPGGWSTTKCIQFQLTLSTTCCPVLQLVKQINYIHFIQQPESGSLCKLNFKPSITLSATYSVPVIQDIDDWFTIFNVVDWLEFRDTCTPSQITNMLLYNDYQYNYTLLDTRIVRIVRNMDNASLDGVLQINKRGRLPYTQMQAVIDNNGNTVNMKSLSVRITCLLDVSIGTLNGLHINRIVSQNYPISLSTYIDFPSYTLITTSNSKECPKTYNVYVSSIGDIALTTSGTYALINSPSFQLVGSQLLINEGLPIQQQFIVQFKDPDQTKTTSVITINQVCGIFSFTTTQALFTNGPVVVFVPLDPSVTQTTAASLEWSNQSNDVGCGPTLVILNSDESIYDGVANDFLAISGKKILINPQKLLTQSIKIRITDVHSVMQVSPILTVSVKCSEHALNASADSSLSRYTNFKTPIEWWQVTSIDSIWPKQSNEVICPRTAEFYRDGVLVTQITADESKVAWIDQGQKLMIHPGKVLDSMFEIRMKYAFESSFKSHNLRIKIEQQLTCLTTSFVKKDPIIKIQAAMKPVSGRIVFRTYQEMRAMFSGPDCPCNPVFRIEKENGKLFEGTSISITNNNLVLETSQPTSIDLNLKAYFQDECSEIQSQSVPVKVDICGPVTPKQPITKQLKLEVQELRVSTTDLESLFENPYKACQMSLSFEQENTLLQISFDTKAGMVIKYSNSVHLENGSKILVNILGTTLGNQPAKNQLIVQLVYPEVSAPLFIEPLRNLMIMIDNQKENNTSTFVYKSPKAIDFQQDSITMSELAIDPVPGCNCFNLSQNSDLTFSLSINTDQLQSNDSKTYTISVTLSDLTASNKFQLTMGLNVIKKGNEKKKAVVEKVAGNSVGQEHQKVSEMVVSQTSERMKKIEIDEGIESWLRDLVFRNQYDVVKAEYSMLKLEKQNVGKEKAFKSSQPVILRIKEINRNGKVKIEFNQPLKIPQIAQSQNIIFQNETEIINTVIIVNSIQRQEDIRFNQVITDWHEWGLELYLNFSNPLAISTGTTKDRIIVKIIDRSLFESLDGKEVLMSDRVYLQKDIPKQLPLGVEEEQIQSQAKAATDSLVSTLVIQIVSQIFLRAQLEEFVLMYMTLQLICYFKIFYVAFPANMEIFLEQFTRLVEFDILNPETIIQKIIDDAEFRLIDWLLGKNKFEEPEKHSIANDLRFWIISGSLFFLVLILVVFLSLYRRYTQKMQKALNYLYKLFIFNGIISTISIMYMQLCVSFGTQIKLKMQGSDVNYGLSLTLFIAMFMISILSWLVIYYFRNRLETPEIREKINALYQDTDLKRKKLWKLAYFPLFLLRKILLVASSFSALFVNFQIQLLVIINIMYLMYYFGIKPHVDLKRRKIESMNELFILCASYHIIVISDFNTKQESLETIGSSFIAVLLLLVVFNVFAVTHKILTSFRLRKILLQKKRFMDKKLREVKQSIKNRTGSLRVDVSDVDSEAGSRDSQSDSVQVEIKIGQLSVSQMSNSTAKIKKARPRFQQSTKQVQLNLNLQNVSNKNKKSNQKSCENQKVKEPISNAVRFYNQIEALVPLQIKLPTADTSPNFSLFLNNLPFKKRQVENISSNFMIQTSKQDEEEEKEEKSERLKKPIVKKSHHSILQQPPQAALINRITLDSHCPQKIEIRPTVFGIQKSREAWLKDSDCPSINIRTRSKSTKNISKPEYLKHNQ